MIPTTTGHGLVYHAAGSWGMPGPLGPPMKPGRPRFVIHHTDSPHVECGVSQAEEIAALRGFAQYQVNKFGRASYHWAVFQSGRVYEMQGWGRVGAHVANNNSTSYGAVLVIDGDKVAPTDAAVEAMRALMGAGLAGGHLAPDFQVMGHGDLLPGYNCPGVMVRPKLAQLFGRTAAPIDRPVLKAGSPYEDAVRELQTLLAMPERHRNGAFGPLTQVAVERFQARHGLIADGIVGPKTWAKLFQK